MLVTIVDVSIVSCDGLLLSVPYKYYPVSDAYRTQTKEMIRLKENIRLEITEPSKRKQKVRQSPGKSSGKRENCSISEKRQPKILEENFLYQFLTI